MDKVLIALLLDLLPVVSGAVRGILERSLERRYGVDDDKGDRSDTNSGSESSRHATLADGSTLLA